MALRGLAFGVVLLGFLGCGAPKKVGPPSATPKASGSTRPPRQAAPPEWFWEEVAVEVRPPLRKQLALPVAEVKQIEGADKLWTELAVDARERLKRDAVLVTDEERPQKMGAFYTDLREQRIPYVITLDALFDVVHTAYGHALADVEEQTLAPALLSFLEKIDARLQVEAAPTTEMADPLVIARGIITIARNLAAGAPSPPLLVSERALIDAHAGVAMSPLLGVPIDYSQLAAPSVSATQGAYRALNWLAIAPLVLVAKYETPQSPVDLTRARTNTRAAMLLARFCAKDVEPAINAAYTKVLRLLSFLYGASDDLTLFDVDDLATSKKVDFTKLESIGNVVRVDAVRTRTRGARAPTLGNPGVTSVRIFGGAAAADSLVLQQMVSPAIGKPGDAAPADRVRAGRRVMPSTLDFTAWLGATESRALVEEMKGDTYERYNEVLKVLQSGRPVETSPELHVSVHGSFMQTLLTWAGEDIPSGRAPAYRARIESILSAWTLVRNSEQPFSRPHPPPLQLTELKVSGTALPAFVEPLPYAIADLLGTVQQLRRGLAKLAPTPTADPMLIEAEDILKVSLEGAIRHASDEAPTSEEAAALGSLPARLARVDEASLAPGPGPRAAVVYTDPGSKRVLVSATGSIEPRLVLVREAGKDDAILAVGAHVGHHEVILPANPPISDGAWRAQPRPQPAAWTSLFRWAKAGIRAKEAP